MDDTNRFTTAFLASPSRPQPTNTPNMESHSPFAPDSRTYQDVAAAEPRKFPALSTVSPMASNVATFIEYSGKKYQNDFADNLEAVQGEYRTTTTANNTLSEIVLVPDGADSILETLEARVKGSAEAEGSVFSDPCPVPTAIDFADSEFTPFLSSSSTFDLTQPPPILYAEGAQQYGATMGAPPTEPEEAEESDSNDYDQLDSDEIEELEGRAWINLPFELQCVDAVLHCVIDLLTDQANKVMEATHIAMEKLLRPETGVGSFAQEILRTSKNNVHEVSRVQGFVRALTQVLNEDEDMALMNFSRLVSHPERFIQPVQRAILEEESDEPELILEAYLQQSVTLSNMVQSMERGVHTTEELVNMKSDTCQKIFCIGAFENLCLFYLIY